MHLFFNVSLASSWRLGFSVFEVLLPLLGCGHLQFHMTVFFFLNLRCVLGLYSHSSMRRLEALLCLLAGQLFLRTGESVEVKVVPNIVVTCGGSGPRICCFNSSLKFSDKFLKKFFQIYTFLFPRGNVHPHKTSSPEHNGLKAFRKHLL